MTKNFRMMLMLATTVGLLAVLPAGMIATADGTAASGYVYDSSSAGYGVATMNSADAASQIAGRGASGLFQWHAQVIPAFNDGNDDEAGYGSCGSSCGKRGILGEAKSTEGFFNCADPKRWTVTNDCDTKDEAETRHSLWAGSEAPLKASEYAKAQSRNSEILTFPVSIAVISVVYNVNGCADGQLKLTGGLISRMYRGNEPDGIRTWNHVELVALNPCLSSENTPIVPVIRCDGSGTTFAFSDFLVRSSGVSAWGPAELIATPAQNEICGPQNPGVSSQVGVNYGAFGYVEKQQADLDARKQAQIQNPDGNFILASEQGGTDAATATAPTLPKSHEPWTTVSIAYAPGATSYSISTFGYLMAIANPADAVDKDGVAYASVWTPEQYNAVKEFLTFANTVAQTSLDVVNYAPVGPVVAALNAEGIDRMNWGPRFSYTLGNDVTDAVLVGYPAVGQKVVAQADGVFTFADKADAKFQPSTAGSLVGITESDGAYVCVTGAVALAGVVVSVDGVPVGTLAQGAFGKAGAILGSEACGQVVNGLLLTHFVQ